MDNTIVCVVGLGYVGLPVAAAFSEKYEVIGFDINETRIEECRRGYDRTGEISETVLKNSNIKFLSDPKGISRANFYIITVPTPIDQHNQPNLMSLIKASETVGSVLKHDDIVVYESTVYPGATEEICLPILEKFSGLVLGRDFGLGYSPERINPADKEHIFSKISKVVSGSDKDVLERIYKIYSSVIDADVFQAVSIKVAEAAKVIENIQRDVNIALMNELAVLFDKLNIDTLEVLKAAGTKWNFLPFRPGLVGGHCIGVDPYYLTYKAESVGYHPQVILSGRRINNQIPKFIVYRMLQELIRTGKETSKCRVLILGVSFKENCPDIRNSKVVDIIEELKNFNIHYDVYDPVVIPKEVESEYGFRVSSLNEIQSVDAVIFAVAHEELKDTYKEIILSKLKVSGCVLDVKGIVDRQFIEDNALSLWRL